MKKMLAEGIVRNIVLYTFLTNHFPKTGEFKYAFRLIDLMIRSQIEAGLVLHIAWLSSVCRNYHWHEEKMVHDKQNVYKS